MVKDLLNGIILITIGIILFFVSKWLWKKGNPKETFMDALGDLISDFISWELPVVFSGIKTWSLLIWLIGLVSVLIGVLLIIF